MSKKLLIKVSSTWSHIDYTTRISATNPSSNYEYIFDKENEVTECDFWIIWGGIKSNQEKNICPPENVIYLTDEVHEERFFNKLFLRQFPTTITCRTDLKEGRVIPSHELNTYMVDRPYDWLYANKEIPKSKTISVISSDQTWLPGHKLRYAFVNKLIGHFKDKLDVYGRGFNPVKDKYDALADYKYSIAIENSVIPGYFTEKIADCYLSHTMPIYYGCPDIESYFDAESLFLIDPNNFKSAIQKIEQIIEEDPYSKALPSLITQKKRYLENYHIFSKIIRILEKEFKGNPDGKRKITIKHERCFQRGYTVNNAINTLFQKLHLPRRFSFQVSLDQTRTYSNK